jgi:hypothetical protein
MDEGRVRSYHSSEIEVPVLVVNDFELIENACPDLGVSAALILALADKGHT